MPTEEQTKAHNEGYDAYFRGVLRRDNPYPPYHPLRIWWWAGWDDAIRFT